MGWLLVFFFTSWRVLFLLEEGVTEGDQKEGRVGFAA